MSHDGDKIAEAIARFHDNVRAAGGADDKNPFAILGKSTLRHAHFERVKAFYVGGFESMREKLYLHSRDSIDDDPGQGLPRRNLDIFFAYMAVLRGDTDIYVPVYNQLNVGYDFVSYTIRHFPLSLIAPHVEFRYIQRSAKPLRYSEAPFIMALTFALAVSHVLENKPIKEGQSEQVVLPQPNGLFLGQAVRMPKENFDYMRGDLVKRDVTTGTVHNLMLVPAWKPTIETRVKTYIHERDFFGAQRLLYDRFAEFFCKKGTADALLDLMSLYAKGAHSHGQLKAHRRVGPMLTALEEIMNGPEWLQAVPNPKQKSLRFDKS